MLHFIYGTNRERGRVAFRNARETLARSAEETVVVREGEVTSGFLETKCESQNLFGGATLYVFDCVLDKKAEQELIVTYAKELSSSTNIFLVFEPAFDKKFAEGVADHATKTEVFTLGDEKGGRAFNVFLLGDALGARNKKELWVLYQQALSAGLEPEELCGTLLWMVRNMALMKNTKSVGDAGLSPFVAKKSRAFAGNYSEEEIKNLSRELTHLYHEAHRGGEAMDIALERFVLAL